MLPTNQREMSTTLLWIALDRGVEPGPNPIKVFSAFTDWLQIPELKQPSLHYSYVAHYWLAEVFSPLKIFGKVPQIS